MLKKPNHSKILQNYYNSFRVIIRLIAKLDLVLYQSVIIEGMTFFSKITKKLNRAVGIDLGSAITRIWVEGKGLVLTEPSLLAVDVASQKVIAVGKQAALMRGRVAQGTEVLAPIQAPKITDDILLKALLKSFLAKVNEQAYLFNPSVLVSISSSFYPAMRQVLLEVLMDLGVREVMMINQALAAAIGAGVIVGDASGSFVFQLGAGAVEVAGLSLGKVVNQQHSMLAGNSIIQELIYWFASKQNLKISEVLAENILRQAVSLQPHLLRSINIPGLDTNTGEPAERRVIASEMNPLITRYGQEYLSLVKKVLGGTSPDLTVDIIEKGLLLSGGLAQLDGLEEYMTQGLGVPAYMIDEPELAVIKGVGRALEQLDQIQLNPLYSLQ